MSEDVKPLVKYLIVKRMDIFEDSYRIVSSYDDFDTALTDLQLMDKLSINIDYIFDIYTRYYTFESRAKYSVKTEKEKE